MKHCSSQPKKSFPLPDFDYRLTMYALAASAAGVGMLALAQPAQGKIVYTNTNKGIGPNSTLHLDLNHDGIADFDLKDTHAGTTFGGGYGELSAFPDQQNNAIWGHTRSSRWAYASALFGNVPIGPKGRFLPAWGWMAVQPASTSCFAPWANVTNRYLGLKFVIKGKTHFGWARLDVSCGNGFVSAILTGYAYESIANRPILSGKERGTEPDNSIPTEGSSAMLGRLARGSKGPSQGE